jgi:hypothetical protein
MLNQIIKARRRFNQISSRFISCDTRRIGTGDPQRLTAALRPAAHTGGETGYSSR